MDEREKRKLEWKAKQGWRAYYRLREETTKLIREMAMGEMSESIKRTIRNLYINSEKRCCVCYEDFNERTKLILLQCGHIFERSCLEASEMDNCMLCRETIDKRIEL